MNLLEVMDVVRRKTLLENNLNEIDELALDEHEEEENRESIRICGDGASSGTNFTFNEMSEKDMIKVQDVKKSKIPIRQKVRVEKSSRVVDSHAGCEDNNPESAATGKGFYNDDNSNSGLVCGDKEFEQNDRIECERDTTEQFQMQGKFRPLASVLEEEEDEEDIVGEDEVDTSSCFNPRGCMEIPLEAPELFQGSEECEKNDSDACANKQVAVDICGAEERHVELSYRDHDNACIAETGDTTRRTINEGSHGIDESSEVQIIRGFGGSEEEEESASLLCGQVQEGGAVARDEDNDHGHNGIVTDRHVGTTAPIIPTTDSDTPQMHVEAHLPIVLLEAGTNEAAVPLGAPFEDVTVVFNDGVVSAVGCGTPEAIDDGSSSNISTASIDVCCDQLSYDQLKGLAGPSDGPDSDYSADKCAAVAAGCDATMDMMVTVCGVCGSSTSGSGSGECECACLCADQLEFEAQITGGPSIRPDGGVAECAPTSGCSRDPTAKVSSVVAVVDHLEISSSCSDPATPPTRSTSDPSTNSPGDDSTQGNSKNLRWVFRNGRLTFDIDNNNSISEDGSDGEEQPQKVLSSKDLNRRTDDRQSRLKYLEQKLKEAGITDDGERDGPLKQVANKALPQEEPEAERHEEEVVSYDSNQNVLLLLKDDGNETEIIPQTTSCFCEFDVRQVGTFSGIGLKNGGYCEVYDELEGDSGSDIIMREDNNMMGAADGSERVKHNPNRDNLKSLLKRPGRVKNGTTKGNRVVFNENKNEFFDADYIILIREECDYDDEDDDGVCTCNQHEMVRLTCCEPNCNCNVYDGCGDPVPQSPKFAPPIEFVDAVTLSPPEGYKDMELGEQQLLALHQEMNMRREHPATVCKECSLSHDEDEDEGDSSQSDNEAYCETSSKYEKQHGEKEKTDQSQQTTPTTPPNDSDSVNNQHYILETITMTTITEQRILREAEEERKVQTSGGSPINGILKGGRLWKQQSLDVNAAKPPEPQQVTESNPILGDEEGSNRRSVRFIESSQDVRDCCDGAPDNAVEEYNKAEENETNTTTTAAANSNANTAKRNNPSSVSPESTEMMLTFKLGNHVLISNNSLKPNSAVRQLFPCTKPLNGKGGDEESIHRYLVTAESLRAFEEAKRSKLPQIIQSGETDESIKRAIERNTLRRSLIRYEPRNKKNVQKTDNSLVERIKQLTCDVDDDTINQECEEPRVSPTGEESGRNLEQPANKNLDKSFSPSSSSTSSNSSSMSSTYKKITDLFGKRESRCPDIQNSSSTEPSKLGPNSLPDLGNGGSYELSETNHCAKVGSNTESRKQFLSTLAPLTACVSGINNTDEFYYHISNNIGERASVASTVGTEYSLEDIDEGLKNNDEDPKRIAPDVLAGTPSASDSGDELAIFVQQDASRIERIKKKYQPEQQSGKEDDEHDDYGFNRRPSVRGIKPRFGSTTEILQQIQNQLQPPVPAAKVAWPYYSESGLTGVDNSKMRNMNQNVPNYQYPPDDMKARTLPPQYRPTTLEDENIYQNCSNQRCVREVAYRTNVNQTYSSVMKVSGGCTEYYQSYPRGRSGRPLSPPPLELSKNYHQTMVYIPYNHIEGYQSTPESYYQSSDYMRVSNQNQINKRFIEPTYQRVHHVEETHYGTAAIPPKPMIRMAFPQPHLMTSRSESPLPGHFSTARATQTPAVPCNFYPGNPRYRPVMCPVWQGDGNYVTKSRQIYSSAVPRYPAPDNISLTDSDSQHSGQIPNGYRQSVELTFSSQKDLNAQGSPTKTKFIERGVPEGAVSAPPQDSSSNSLNSSSTLTSPTSPQNSTSSNQKPLFYAMNV